MSLPGAVGLTSMLKDGAKHYAGTDEAVLRNIQACKELSEVVQTSMGPNGMNKMVVNHLEKIFVTHDAATIMRELEVFHPAAKLIVEACNQQEQEVGDGTNLVIVMAGQLLHQAADLIVSGLHVNEVLAGYQKALKHALAKLKELSEGNVVDVRDVTAVGRVLQSVAGTKVLGYEDVVGPLVADACMRVCPQNVKAFNVDNVRVVKIEGSSLMNSQLVNGFVLPRDAAGTIKHVKNAKVAVYTSALDVASTETKGTVLLHNAEDLMAYNKSEEDSLEKHIKMVADAGVNVIVSGSNISDLSLHFIERYGMMAVKCPSKFQLRRLCKCTGAAAKTDLGGAPLPGEIGECEEVTVEEFGSTKAVIFRQADGNSARVVSIVVRGATQSAMNDAERAVDDAVNVFKALCTNAGVLPGAGATEIELANSLQAYADECPGLDQYAVRKFAECFETVPRTLASNSGFNDDEVLSNLYTAHSHGNKYAGVNIDDGEIIENVMESGIIDSLYVKESALKLTGDAVLNILRVDQIIMSKPAGGPKPPKQGGMPGGMPGMPGM